MATWAQFRNAAPEIARQTGAFAAPLLIANREDVDEIVDILDVTIGEVEQELEL